MLPPPATFLNEFLHKIKASDTALCDCGSTESIAHFLFACRRWGQQRTQLRQQQRFGELSYALGGYSSKQEGGQSIDGPMERWKADIAAVKATIEFAKDTGRLQPEPARRSRQRRSRGGGAKPAPSAVSYLRNSKLPINVPRPACCRLRGTQRWKRPADTRPLQLNSLRCKMLENQGFGNVLDETGIRLGRSLISL